MANGLVYNLVERLAAALLPRRRVLKGGREDAAEAVAELEVRHAELEARQQEIYQEEPAGPDQLAEAPDVPEVIPFLGFRGGAVQRPGGADFRMLYLDVGLQEWLLVEEAGIFHDEQVEDKQVPGQRRQMLWVNVNAAVGRGKGPQSVEARFLTGEFTRAGDFEAPLGGGRNGPSTGVFCEARTPTCCRFPSR